jgi:hypothetical protein
VKYQTPLNPISQMIYDEWVKQQSAVSGRDLSLDTQDYDLPGFWQSEGWYAPMGNAHGPDTYKKPWHPTFSEESQYQMTPDDDGSLNLGGSWGDGVFNAGPTNRNNWSLIELLKYFAQQEPDYRLNYGGLP